MSFRIWKKKLGFYLYPINHNPGYANLFQSYFSLLYSKAENTLMEKHYVTLKTIYFRSFVSWRGKRWSINFIFAPQFFCVRIIVLLYV